LALVDRKAILESSEEAGPSIRRFRFRVPELDAFSFVPGQWVSLVGDVHGKTVTRAYSLSALPQENLFEICLNRVEGGLFSPFLFDLQPGDSLIVRGPVGAFTIRSREREAVLVATGTGVVPFRPMLQQPGYLHSGIKVKLIFGARYESGLIFHGEFSELAAQFPNFQYTPTVTRPSETWSGQSGRVQPKLWETIGERTDLDVYVCGLKEMVDDVRQGLKDRGFDRKQIIYEKYD
jgi:ferredoxin-NADP reductase